MIECCTQSYVIAIFTDTVANIDLLGETNVPYGKGWLAIAKLKPLSLFISLLSMLKKALDNVEIEKWKVKVVSALQ